MRKALLMVSNKEEVDYLINILNANEIKNELFSNYIILKEIDWKIKIQKTKSKISSLDKDYEDIIIYENIYMNNKIKKRFAKVLKNINYNNINKVYNNYTEYVLNKIAEKVNINNIKDIVDDIKKEG